MTDGVYQPVVHYDCLENQIQSIHNRVCGVVPHPTQDGKQIMRLAAVQLARTLPPTFENDIYDLSKRHVGLKAARYATAARQLEMVGPSKSDANIKAFIKPERFDLTSKVNPDPRMIQFRGAKYCVELASYLRPIEEHIYLMDSCSDGVPASRNVAKGLNSVERAELLVHKMSHFTSPVILGLDASRFDKHVSVDHLRAEASVYLYSNPHPRFRELLRMQERNTCFTSLGVKYVTSGRRMSGDMNTAVGNVLIMLIMLVAICRIKVKLLKWDTLDDGDDALVIIEEADLARFSAQVEALFLSMGMKIKLDEPVRNVHQVVFCKSQVVEFRPMKFKFVRNYLDVFSKSLCGVRNWPNATFRLRAMHAIGVCELVLNLGVPVLQAFALAVMRNTSGRGIDHAPDGLRARATREARNIGLTRYDDLKPQPIHDCARASFALAFGVSESEQRELEYGLDHWVFSNGVPDRLGEYVNVTEWVWMQTYSECYQLRNDFQ